MSDDDELFGNTSVSSSDTEDATLQEHLDLIHDPDVLYYYIKDAHNKTEQDLTIDTDGKAERVNIHAQVEVFQSTIQYVEAFGIYLIAYIKGRDDFVHNLTKTYPSEVESFFDAVANDSTAAWLAEEDVATEYEDDAFDTIIQKVFGYAYIDQETVTQDGDSVSDEKFEEITEHSVQAITQKINRLGDFYSTFKPIYNAVKHGNRALPVEPESIEVNPSDDESEFEGFLLDLDMQFVTFVCKNKEGSPYLVQLPIEYLVEQTLETTERTHDVFTQLKEVSEADITDDSFSVPYYTPVDNADTEEDASGSDRDGSTEWIAARHPSGVYILPKTEEISDISSEPQKLAFAGRIDIHNGELTVSTEMDAELSEEYPIDVTIVHNGFVALTNWASYKIRLQFTLNELDAKQYLQVLELDETIEGEGVSSTVIEKEGESEGTITLGDPDSFPSLNVEEVVPREELEQLALLQQITQRYIPAPFEISEEQREVVRESIDALDEQEDAVSVVDELEEIGNDAWLTVFMVEKQLPDGEVVEETAANMAPGTFELWFENSETGESYSTLDREVEVPIAITGKTYEEVVSEVEANPNVVEDYLACIANTDVVPTDIGMKLRSELPKDGFWNTEQRLVLEVLASTGHPDTCPLCGGAVRDASQHLLKECPAMS